VLALDFQDHSLDGGLGEIHLLFDLQVQQKHLCLCSAEGTRGETCYSIAIEVSEIDVEIADQEGVQARKPPGGTGLRRVAWEKPLIPRKRWEGKGARTASRYRVALLCKRWHSRNILEALCKLAGKPL
jgi:hypothetical protein